tara:strand:+ start:326 stop:1708 length:1383 start_codon:yes stop_codon:yes gene_type:complete
MSGDAIVSQSASESIHYVMKAEPNAFMKDLPISTAQLNVLGLLQSASFQDIILSGAHTVLSGSTLVSGSGSFYNTETTSSNTVKIIGPQDTYLITGSMIASKDSNQIKGVSGSTTFDTQLSNGDYIKIVSASYNSYHTITLSDTNHDTQTAAAGTGTGIPTALTGNISLVTGSIAITGTSGSSNFTGETVNGDTIKIVSGSYSSYHIITHSIATFSDNIEPLTGSITMTTGSYFVSGSSSLFTTNVTASHESGSFTFLGTRLHIYSASVSSFHTITQIHSNISMSIFPYWTFNTFTSRSVIYPRHENTKYTMSMYPEWAGNTTSSVSIYKQYKNSAFSMSINPVWGGSTTSSDNFIYKNDISSSQLCKISKIHSATSMSLTSNYLGSNHSSASMYSIENQFIRIPAMTLVSEDLWKADWDDTNAIVPNVATSSKPPSYNETVVTSSMTNASFRIVTSSGA